VVVNNGPFFLKNRSQIKIEIERGVEGGMKFKRTQLILAHDCAIKSRDNTK
jgi:hypothetical protein